MKPIGEGITWVLARFFWVIAEGINLIVRGLYFLRTIYLNVVTLGAWRNLGSFAMELADDLSQQKDLLQRTEWRLDGLMRLIEHESHIVIPDDIEPPRLTTYGEGMPMDEESVLMKESIDQLKREKADGKNTEAEQVQVPQSAGDEAAP